MPSIWPIFDSRCILVFFNSVFACVELACITNIRAGLWNEPGGQPGDFHILMSKFFINTIFVVFDVLRFYKKNMRFKIHCVPKSIPDNVDYDLEKQLADFDNFWYKYF